MPVQIELVAPLFAIAGVLLGWASWMAAMRLTATARFGEIEKALLVLAGGIGGGVLGFSSARSEGRAAAVVVVAVLATPLLVTLLTDLQARLVFPAVLLPAILAACLLAAAGLLDVPLQASLVTGSVAAAVTALVFALTRSIWSDSAEPPLGSGDILVVAFIGAVFGPDHTPRVLFAGMVLAAAAAGSLLLARRAQRHAVIPYGAFLCAAALAALAIQVCG